MTNIDIFHEFSTENPTTLMVFHKQQVKSMMMTTNMKRRKDMFLVLAAHAFCLDFHANQTIIAKATNCTIAITIKEGK